MEVTEFLHLQLPEIISTLFCDLILICIDNKSIGKNFDNKQLVLVSLILFSHKLMPVIIIKIANLEMT